MRTPFSVAVEGTADDVLLAFHWQENRRSREFSTECGVNTSRVVS
jgi:hypothetical protein